MRKVLFLTCIIAGILVGCSSDDSIILPINVTDGPIAVFFNAELPELNKSSDFYRNSKSFFYDPDSYGGTAIEENRVCIINSRQELADIYLGDKELPEIDFDKYTLVIGQQIMPVLGFYIVNKKLVESGEEFVLKLYARNDGEVLATALQNLYFWGLYPKLAQKTISVSVSTYYSNYSGL